MFAGKSIVLGSALAVAGFSAMASGATVAAWNFDSLSGGNTVATDISGNGHNVTFGGDVVSLSNSDPFDPSGAESANKSLSKPTAEVWGLITNPGTILPAYGSFTMEGWIYPKAHQYSTLIGFGGATDYGNNDVVLGMDNLGHPAARVLFEDNGGGSHSGSEVIPLNQWTHLALTYNGTGSVVTLYVNGNVSTTWTQGSWVVGQPVPTGVIGDGFDYGNLYGMIDDVRVSNVVLSPSEFTLHQSLTVPEPASMALLGLGGLLLIRRRRSA